MGRSAVAIVTGLCTAPLFGVLGFALTDLVLGPGGGSDTSIAKAYMALVIGVLAFIVGGIVTGLAVQFWLPSRFRPHILIADAVLVMAMIAGWQIFVADPSPLDYADARPVLEAEIRVPLAIGSDAIEAISFIEGLLDSRYDDRIRTEGDTVIIPWETTPYRVKDWAIQIMLQGHDNWTRFDLDLPARPTESTDWSPWLTPVSGEELDVVEGVNLRYRFRLIPHGE